MTSRLLAVFVMTFCAALSPASARAESAFAAEFQTLGINARALAMGGGYAALADDATALYWNPAGLGQLADRAEAAFMHSSLYGLDSYDAFNVAKPFGDATWGLQWLRVGVDDIEITAVEDVSSPVSSVNRPTKVRTESVSNHLFVAGMGRRLTPNGDGGVRRLEGFVGAAGKFLYVSSGAPRGANGVGVGGDVGALAIWRVAGDTQIRAAINAQDFFRTSVYWNTAPTTGEPSHKDTVLQNAKAALALVAPIPLGDSRLAIHVETDSRNDFELHSGAEWTIADTLAMRIGLQERKSATATLRDMTAGAGFRLGFTGGQSFRVAYAFTGHDLGDSHRVSLGVQF